MIWSVDCLLAIGDHSRSRPIPPYILLVSLTVEKKAKKVDGASNYVSPETVKWILFAARLKISCGALGTETRELHRPTRARHLRGERTA